MADPVSSAGPAPGRRHRWGGRGAHRRRGASHRLLIAVGAALVLAAVGWQVNATVWSAHAQSVGHRLIRQVRAERAASGAVTCTVAPDAPQGLLQAPSIGLVAPVEQGTDDAVLSVAVGHDPSSVWPGASGNAVLEAHDVSYFVDIDQLRTGDTVDYATPCATYVFAVQGHQVVEQGSPVFDTASPTLTMVTCWPTDALWFTPDRYVVTATEVRVQRSTPRTLRVPAGTGSSSAPSVAAPPALVAEGLTLSSYSVPMGTLSIRGTPSPAWVESPAPLADQQAAVEAFIAGVRAAVQRQTAWWDDIAPGVQIPVPLVGAEDPSYLSALDVTVTAVGSRATAVQLTTTVAVTGGSAPGHYAMTVDDAIAGHRLRIAAWVLRAV